MNKISFLLIIISSLFAVKSIAETPNSHAEYKEQVWSNKKPELSIRVSDNKLYVSLSNNSDGLIKLRWITSSVIRAANSFYCEVREKNGKKVESWGIKPYVMAMQSESIVTLHPSSFIGISQSLAYYSFNYKLKENIKYTVQCYYSNKKSNKQFDKKSNKKFDKKPNKQSNKKLAEKGIFIGKLTSNKVEIKGLSKIQY